MYPLSFGLFTLPVSLFGVCDCLFAPCVPACLFWPCCVPAYGLFWGPRFLLLDFVFGFLIVMLSACDPACLPCLPVCLYVCLCTASVCLSCFACLPSFFVTLCISPLCPLHLCLVSGCICVWPYCVSACLPFFFYVCMFFALPVFLPGCLCCCIKCAPACINVCVS